MHVYDDHEYKYRCSMCMKVYEGVCIFMMIISMYDLNAIIYVNNDYILVIT